MVDQFELFLELHRQGIDLLRGSLPDRQSICDHLAAIKKIAASEKYWNVVAGCDRYLELDQRRVRRRLLDEAIALFKNGCLEEAWNKLLFVQSREGSSPSLELVMNRVDDALRKAWIDAVVTESCLEWILEIQRLSERNKPRKLVVALGFDSSEQGKVDSCICKLNKELGTVSAEIVFLGRQEASSLINLLNPSFHYWTSIAVINSLSSVSTSLLQEVELLVVVKGVCGDLVEAQPECCLITTLFRSELYLSRFLENCSGLEGYGNNVAHAFVVARPSRSEALLLIDHLYSHSRVAVLCLRDDPGLYASWNKAVVISQSEFLSNANVDDLRDPSHVRVLVECLYHRPQADIAASSLRWMRLSKSDDASRIFLDNPYAHFHGWFGLSDLGSSALPQNHRRMDPINLPHCMPVWRRCLHDQYGFFDEDSYGSFADWAFWLNVMSYGRRGWFHSDALGTFELRENNHAAAQSDLALFHQRIEDDFYSEWEISAK